jgi:hypothetical protein
MLQTRTAPQHMDTLDTAIVCGSCLDTLAPDGACLNISGCIAAQTAAGSRSTYGATVKAPAAWQGSGNVD